MGTNVTKQKEMIHNSLLVCHLDPPNNPITYDFSYRNIRLEQYIYRCKSGKFVELESMGLSDRDIPIVVELAIIQKKCVLIGLGGNYITSQGMWIIANALCLNTTLESLVLWNNNISDIGVEYISQCLKLHNSTLIRLTIASNGITDVGVHHLAEVMKTNRTIRSLNLSNNLISDEGVIELANVIIHYETKLQRLMLDSSKLITDRCVETLVTMLKHNRSLVLLWIYDCNISITGKTALQQAVLKKKDFVLHVDGFIK